MKIRLNHRAATIVAAAALTAGAAVAVTPTAAFADEGIRLSTGHGVGVYGWYFNIDNAHKVAPDLWQKYNGGIDADCWSNLGANLGSGPYWYHTIAEYYNNAGQTVRKTAWTYAPYVDNNAAINNGSLPYCNY